MRDAHLITHTVEGPVTSNASGRWLAEPIARWRAAGWFGYDLRALRVESINKATVSFKASWSDRYAGGETALSCGWYLADYLRGDWRFTAYADIDCPAQDLATARLDPGVSAFSKPGYNRRF